MNSLPSGGRMVLNTNLTGGNKDYQYDDDDFMEEEDEYHQNNGADD